MGAEPMEVGPNKWWGTWEELILGGAVLRHGCRDWNVVASELRARTLYPSVFTPEACKAKYEDLRKQYSGSSAWFEELRKRRMAELRRDLEKSENSIGSLESKMESLKTEKSIPNGYGSSQTDSPLLVIKQEAVESFDRETSKDGLSAGSFTQDDRINQSLESRGPMGASAAETDSKPEVSQLFDREKGLSVSKSINTSSIQEGTVKRRRGKRKRKECGKDIKEGSMEASENICSTSTASTSQWREVSTSNLGETKAPVMVDRKTGEHDVDNEDLIGIFDSVVQNECAMVFRHRLDSQKRARYKKLVREHMDLDMIRSRLVGRTIRSPTELFRDLLLLANNALVFYSKRMREYKSALLFRDIITKAYRQQLLKSGNNKAPSSLIPSWAMCNPPVKPRSARPRPAKLKQAAKWPGATLVVGISKQPTVHELKGTKVEELKRTKDADANVPSQSVLMTKKCAKKPSKVRRKVANPRPQTPVKERKNSRRK